MQKTFTFIGSFAAVIAAMAILFLGVILSTLMGGVTGWIVGLFFSNTILPTLSRFGLDTFGLTMWQLGATIGFIGGFFRSNISTRSNQ